jgi:hypothetical protein
MNGLLSRWRVGYERVSRARKLQLLTATESKSSTRLGRVGLGALDTGCLSKSEDTGCLSKSENQAHYCNASLRRTRSSVSRMA